MLLFFLTRTRNRKAYFFFASLTAEKKKDMSSRSLPEVKDEIKAELHEIERLADRVIAIEHQTSHALNRDAKERHALEQEFKDAEQNFERADSRAKKMLRSLPCHVQIGILGLLICINALLLYFLVS